ncbi:hypothetical protein DR950_10060 [Kitasatospora xanthocidica]|uniref:Uncharacterized protein n=1 Tax=Kitasatospora xanthocidica TaxID=83382 RepID=A0A372ZQA9_9ACTN|nr:hypothetical protein DR950_10060 [Kitasatospora xanthocidica]
MHVMYRPTTVPAGRPALPRRRPPSTPPRPLFVRSTGFPVHFTGLPVHVERELRKHRHRPHAAPPIPRRPPARRTDPAVPRPPAPGCPEIGVPPDRPAAKPRPPFHPPC